MLLPQKVAEQIRSMPSPKNQRQVMAVIGFLTFYNCLVNHGKTRMKPLAALLKKNQLFEWTDVCERNFRESLEELYKSHLAGFTKLNYGLSRVMILLYSDWSMTTNSSNIVLLVKDYKTIQFCPLFFSLNFYLKAFETKVAI